MTKILTSGIAGVCILLALGACFGERSDLNTAAIATATVALAEAVVTSTPPPPTARPLPTATPFPTATLAPSTTTLVPATNTPTTTPTAMPTRVPANTSSPVPATATSVAQAPDLQSGGLGMTWEAWLAKMGPPEKELGFTFTWNDAALKVDVINGRVYKITRSVTENKPEKWEEWWWDKDALRALAFTLMPLDAVFVEEHIDDGNEYEVYYSAQLAAAYPDGYSGGPGTLSIDYIPAGDDAPGAYETIIVSIYDAP